MDKGGYAGIPDVVVLSVCIQTGRGPQGGVGSGRAGVAQSGGSGHQNDGGGHGEAHLLAQRHIQHRNHGDGAEGAADAHGDQKANQGDNGGGDNLVAAHDADSGLNQLIHRAGGLDHVGIAAGHQHDKGNHAHDLEAALKLLVNFLPLDGAEHKHDHQAAQGGQSQRLGGNLNGNHHNNGQKGDGVLLGELIGDSLGGGHVHRQLLVLTGLTISDKDGQTQANQHGNAENPVVSRNLADGGGHAVLGHIVGNDAHEDGAEAKGNGDVGSLQAECQRAGGSPAVKLQLVEQAQQGRNHDGNESDVNGNQVLGQAGHAGQHYQKELGVLSHDFGELLGHHVGQARGGDGGGKGAQQQVSQRGAAVYAEAGGQDTHGGGNVNAAQNGANNGGDDQGQKNVQLQQAQDTQDHHRHKNRIQ
ncbi:hypothetical protein SDC9_82104 [bioreactor metagenome]|uniref:Uncharacterized protein n=1 Tax=bioreactor metagenome TaxID=1076179 RepID=A0A644Z681_9ZZZZ